jgi:TfoX/Sxy family transcriptional regulator of competence genes
MAYNLERTEQVRVLLAINGVTDAIERKMFGSIGFIVNDKLCIGVGDHSDHVMMVRIGLDAYDKCLEEIGVYPALMRGKEQKGYVFLQNEAVQTQDQLEKWVRRAITYNQELTSKPPAR